MSPRRRGSRGGGWDGWGDWGYAKPRIPANGIKAISQRGRFGQTWWAGRWLAALEQVIDPGRLSRGRSYARSGQVVKVDAGPHGVDARVQGSRPTPYKVSIRFRPLSDAEWDRVTDVMAKEALYAARLLGGEMPEQIEDAFQAAGAPLFPTTAGDLETDCTCPDWANPCKHVAAVYYLLGERFDADPFLMFELRGRTNEQIMAALRAHRAAAAPAAAAGLAAAESGDAPALGAEPQEEATPLTYESPEAFWSPPAALVESTTSFEPLNVDALPVKLLGTPPFWPDQRGFTPAMEQAYRALSARALRLAMEGR
jgi:uncharacterized Zn finger protein